MITKLWRFSVFLLCYWSSLHPITSFANIAPDLKQSRAFSLPHTLVRDVRSRANGVQYRLYISLPKNYYSTKKHYPVIYLLDADYSFALAKQISEHLSDRNRIKESIIVGIAYANSDEYKKNRTRDYTPTYVATGGYGVEYQKYSGGAEFFYQFLASELIPYFKQQFRVGDSTLVGHSFGGLFAGYLLMKHSEVFNHYVIVSPSLWYDRHLLLKMAKEKAHFNVPSVQNVLLIIGSEENKGNYRMVDDLKKLEKILSAKAHNHLQFSLNIVANSDHDTVFPMALTQGLMKLNQ